MTTAVAGEPGIFGELRNNLPFREAVGKRQKVSGGVAA